MIKLSAYLVYVHLSVFMSHGLNIIKYILISNTFKVHVNLQDTVDYLKHIHFIDKTNLILIS